jgi:hypothetical protein
MMGGQDARSRRATAVAAAGRLAEAVKLGGPSAQVWYRKLLDIRDVLGSPVSDEEALGEAVVMFGALYEGPRNFSDFYIWREDEAARIRENKQIEDDVRTLRESLNS